MDMKTKKTNKETPCVTGTDSKGKAIPAESINYTPLAMDIARAICEAGFTGMDKCLYSKANNTDVYGIMLCPQAKTIENKMLKKTANNSHFRQERADMTRFTLRVIDSLKSRLQLQKTRIGVDEWNAFLRIVLNLGVEVLERGDSDVL